MGPRTFVANKAADFLINHGNLDERILDHCLELHHQPSTVPWWQALAYYHSIGSVPHHVYEAQLASHHPEMILVASSVIKYNIKKHMEWKRKRRPYLSRPPSALSNCVDEIAAIMACSSLYLVAIFVGVEKLMVLLLHYDARFMVRAVGFLEESSSWWSTSQYLFTTSLWAILIAIVLTMAPAAWHILDPRNCGATTATKGGISFWCSLDRYNAAAVSFSIGVVLWLAYTDLPLFNMLQMDGTTRIQIDFGLPQALTNLIQQALSSFVGFCIFYKFLPNDTTATSLPADSTTQMKTTTVLKKKSKKPAADPEIVKRMSMLASEAREHHKARKNRSTKQLRRTYSEGNLRAPMTPPRRRTSSRQNSKTLMPLPEHKSPLNDIHLAGPTLSSRDLMAKLKDNDCCVIKHSISSGCLEKLPLKSILIPMPLAVASADVPNLAEEEKVMEEGDEGELAVSMLRNDQSPPVQLERRLE